MCSIENIQRLNVSKEDKKTVKEITAHIKDDVLKVMIMLKNYIAKNDNISIISKLLILENNSIEIMKKTKDIKEDGTINDLLNMAVINYHEILLELFHDNKKIYIKKALCDSMLKFMKDKQSS